MTRKELSTHFTNDIVRIIQYKILPDKSNYLFLDEIKEIYLYSLCFIYTHLLNSLSIKISFFSYRCVFFI